MGRKGGHQKPPRYCRKAWLAFFYSRALLGAGSIGLFQGVWAIQPAFYSVRQQATHSRTLPLGVVGRFGACSNPPFSKELEWRGVT
jgi:hypothetical protein